MRPASEIANQICGCATREQHNRDVALIEADRQALVAEICEWLGQYAAHLVTGQQAAIQSAIANIQAKWGASHDQD